MIRQFSLEGYGMSKEVSNRAFRCLLVGYRWINCFGDP